MSHKWSRKGERQWHFYNLGIPFENISNYGCIPDILLTKFRYLETLVLSGEGAAEWGLQVGEF